MEKNARVYMAARDSQKSKEALEDLKKETATKGSKGSIEFIPLDLADLQSVRKAAELFLRYVV